MKEKVCERCKIKVDSPPFDAYMVDMSSGQSKKYHLKCYIRKEAQKKNCTNLDIIKKIMSQIDPIYSE